MWFFYLKFFLVEIWLTLATWSKSRITHQWPPPLLGRVWFGEWSHRILSYSKCFPCIKMLTLINFQSFTTKKKLLARTTPLVSSMVKIWISCTDNLILFFHNIPPQSHWKLFFQSNACIKPRNRIWPNTIETFRRHGFPFYFNGHSSSGK